MEYVEEYMWPLTGGTTCYTGIRDGKGATEWHTLCLSSDGNLSSRQISSRDNALVCVGYSTTATHECLVLLDLSRFDTPETPSDLQQPQSAYHTNNNDRVTNDMDDQSVSNATITTNASTTRASSPENNNSTSQLIAQSLDSFSSFIEAQSTHAANTTTTTTTSTAALLMVRALNEPHTVEFTKTLDYRPLSPLLCHFPTNDTMGIWLGSSDHSELHLFVCRDSVWQFYNLNHMSEFQFNSPIMCIDYASPDALAVACQDGTMRIIRFQFDGYVFSNVSEQQVMVDGPILCLTIRSLVSESSSLSTSSMKWHVTAGSLCGYAMEWFVDTDPNTYNLSMIAKGFWNGAIGAEDSVLAVRSTDTRVLIGTQSGKVLLYEVVDLVGVNCHSSNKDNDKEDNKYNHNIMEEKKRKQDKRSFRLLWQCQLPYSIHGVEFLQGDEGKLLITTRKSIHIFKQGQFNAYQYAALLKEKLKTKIQSKIRSDNVIMEEQVEIAS